MFNPLNSKNINSSALFAEFSTIFYPNPTIPIASPDINLAIIFPRDQIIDLNTFSKYCNFLHFMDIRNALDNFQSKF